MKICGIIAEYNPFHNGHAYQVEQLRAQGFTHIIALMSSNFVQRGEAALLSKHRRALAAICSGVDLVLEFPLPYCASTAQKFASSGVDILEKLACIDGIGFGCEHNNMEKVRELCKFLDSDKLDKIIKDSLATGITYAKARHRAVLDVMGLEYANLIAEPNDILAVEYIRALTKIKSKIVPVPILRTGVSHDSREPSGNIASASFIRSALLNGQLETIEKYVPGDSYRIIAADVKRKRCPATLNNCERAVLCKLRELTDEQYPLIPDFSEGLENRIQDKVKSSHTIIKLIDSVKTKRYTHARIKRIILHSFLGITKSDFAPITSVRILGLGDKGEELVSLISKKSKLAVYGKYNEVKFLDENSRRIFELEDHAYDLFSLCTPRVMPCNQNKTNRIVSLRENEKNEN